MGSYSRVVLVFSLKLLPQSRIGPVLADALSFGILAELGYAPGPNQELERKT